MGDPTVGDWLVVFLYFLTAFTCWIAARSLDTKQAGWRNERRAWRAIAAAFLVLGVNKQLDLQTALTEAGRVLARFQGWYEHRQAAQALFIGLVAALCVVAAVALLGWARKATAATWLALVGANIIVAFVLIRAGSFHHIDRLIGVRTLGVQASWIVEMGGIVTVLGAGLWRRLELRELRVRHAAGW